MVCSHRNSRFRLASRTANASNHSHFQPRDCLCPGGSHSSVFFSPRAVSEIVRPFVFNHLRTPCHSFANDRPAISLLFNHFHTLCRSKSTRGWVSPLSPPKYLHQSASASDASLARRSAQTDHASERKLAAALLTMSLFRHIATSLPSAEKPYPTPYHLMAKRYRTHPRSVGVYSGSRVCFRCPGLKWFPGFRVCSCQP